MRSCLRIPAFRLRSWEVHPRRCCTSLSFSEHWFLAPHASQPAIPYRSYLESELECMPRQPDHRRNQGHQDVSRDLKKFLTTSAWFFIGCSYDLVDENEENQRSEHTSTTQSCLHLEEVRNTFLWYFHNQNLPPIFRYFYSFPHSIKKEVKDSNRCWQVRVTRASIPVALLFFNNLMASATSVTVGVFTLIVGTFVGGLFCLLCHLVSESSHVSSGIHLNFLIHGVVVFLDTFTDPFRFWIK